MVDDGTHVSTGLRCACSLPGCPLLAGLAARQWDQGFNLTRVVGAFGESAVLSLVFYIVLLAVPLYLVARRVQRSVS